MNGTGQFPGFIPGPYEGEQQEQDFRYGGNDYNRAQAAAGIRRAGNFLRRKGVQHVRHQASDVPDLVHNAFNLADRHAGSHSVPDFEYILFQRIHGPSGDRQLHLTAALGFPQQHIQRLVRFRDQFLHAAFLKGGPAGRDRKQVLRDGVFQGRFHARCRVHPADHRLRPGGVHQHDRQADQGRNRQQHRNGRHRPADPRGDAGHSASTHLRNPPLRDQSGCQNLRKPLRWDGLPLAVPLRRSVSRQVPSPPDPGAACTVPHS